MASNWTNFRTQYVLHKDGYRFHASLMGEDAYEIFKINDKENRYQVHDGLAETEKEVEEIIENHTQHKWVECDK